MEAVWYPEMLVSYITLWCHNPEDDNYMTYTIVQLGSERNKGFDRSSIFK